MPKILKSRKYKDITVLEARLHERPEFAWVRSGQKQALNLFHAMAAEVPAYKDFLKSRKFSPSSVTRIADFSKIPPIDKDNYLRKYPTEMLCWRGDFTSRQWVISATSGSSGMPFYFPRSREQDSQYALSAELYLRSNFAIHKRTTLYIIAFPMGIWIGGVFTYEALKIISEKDEYKLSIMTPGIHKQEVIKAVKQFGKSFDQIIIGAYAPFLKDILEDGKHEGIRWSDYKVGFIFSAEAFTERFRDYVIRETKPDNILTATLNHYGTVDLGTMAHETPESILIRRELVDRQLLTVLFPENVRQPTFAQYHPGQFYFEEELGNLFCSANSGLPLVRYDLKDYGGILSQAHVHQRLLNAGIDIVQLKGQRKIDQSAWNLPFVYVYERNDFSVSYYAFQLYPDTIRHFVEQEELRIYLTGKFTIFVDYSKRGRQRLNLVFELQRNIEANNNLTASITQKLHQMLVEHSSEYRETFKIVGLAVKPRVRLLPYEDVAYFKPGIKQKWVLKDES